MLTQLSTKFVTHLNQEITGKGGCGLQPRQPLTWKEYTKPKKVPELAVARMAGTTANTANCTDEGEREGGSRGSKRVGGVICSTDSDEEGFRVPGHATADQEAGEDRQNSC